MVQYGSKKATEFTTKQINVIYAKAKSGMLKIEKWVISELYDLANYYGYDDNGSVSRLEWHINNIIEAVFAGNIESAQELLSEYADREYECKSLKARAKIDRTAFVA